MKKNSKIKDYFYRILILILIVLFIREFLQKRKSLNLVKSYKLELLGKDSLRKIAEGQYQKLVNDTKTQKELNKILKEHNIQLYETLKSESKKLISYTIIQARPKSKIDTVKITDIIKEGQKVRYFEDFYPKKENHFIKYSANIYQDKVIGEWNPTELNIGIVISEKVRGIFEADLDAPDWLNVTDIQVNSLPLENIRKDNFDWIVGANTGWSFERNIPVFEIEGGFRFKKQIFSIQGNTNKEVKGGIKILF